MKEKLQRFMIGRYGVDSLNKFLLGASIVLMIMSMLTRRGNALYTLALLLLAFSYVRMFSRNTQKRYQENIKFWNIKNKFLGFFKKQRSYMEQRKTHHHSYADRPVGTGRLWRQHPGHKEVRHERDQTRESVDEQVLGSKYCCQHQVHDRSSPIPPHPSHSGTWSITVVLAIPSSTWAVRAPP